ncbi:MAG: hypothetical protein ACO1RA_00120 [Planctomycetaceae bacterium]
MLYLALEIGFNQAARDKQQLAAKLDSLRAAGVPIDSQSLDAWYRKRTDATNTMAWMKVFQALKSPEFRTKSFEVDKFTRDIRTLSRTQNHWPGEGPVREFLTQTSELRAEIRRISEARTPVQLPLQFNLKLANADHLNLFREAMRLILLEINVAIADRDSSQITASTQTLLNISEMLRSGPFANHLLIVNSFRQLAFSGLKEALERNLLEPQDLETLAKALSQEPPPFENFSDVVHGEIGLVIQGYFTLPDPSKKRFLSGPLDPRIASTQDMLRYLGHTLKYLDIEGCSMADAIEKQKGYTAQLAKEIKASEESGDSDWRVTKEVFQDWRGVVTTICRDRQSINMVLHGIAIRRYQKQFGEFPKDLAALKEVGFDTADFMPVGNLPMGYRLEEGGCTLWSTPPELGMVTTPEPIALDPPDRNYLHVQQMLWKFTP